jgi:hypothetical protein
MSIRTDLSSLLTKYEQQVKDLAVEFMTQYDHSLHTFERRDLFTEKLMKVFEIISNFQFNDDGSFTDAGAKDALASEASFILSNLTLIVRVFGRLYELENGLISYGWLQRKWESSLRKRAYAAGARTLASEISRDIKDGVHKSIKPEARPYIGKAVEFKAPELANDIHELLMEKLPIRLVRWENSE